MSHNKHILADVDQVLFDFTNTFCDWVEGEKKLVPLSERNNVDRLFRMYGTPEPVMREYIEEFSINPAFGTMRPLRGAKEALQNLREAGYGVEVITACYDHADVRSMRETALKDAFDIDPEHIHYVGLLQSKYELLRGYRPCIWVEDNAANALDGVLAGHRTFLFDYGYNRSVPVGGIERVSGWADVEAALFELVTN